MILDVIDLITNDPMKQRRVLDKETKISVRELFTKLDIRTEDVLVIINRQNASLDQVLEQKDFSEDNYYLIVAVSTKLKGCRPR